MVDQQCRGSNGKLKIEGYTRVSDKEAHHPLSTEIVTGECWGMEGKAEGGEENMVQEKVGEKLWSNWALHQSGSSKEEEKEQEGKLEKEVMEGLG